MTKTPALIMEFVDTIKLDLEDAESVAKRSRNSFGGEREVLMSTESASTEMRPSAAPAGA